MGYLCFLVGEYMKTIDVLAAILLVIGGLNWGLIGLFGFNFIDFLFAAMPVVATAIYILVGFSAVWQAVQWQAIQERWS